MVNDENQLVSVVIPIYNREKTIIRAINSVLSQTYTNVEVIVVDDCSEDNSVRVVKQLESFKIRIIELSENHGAAYARNVGIKASNGYYIAFLDSDDEWFGDKNAQRYKGVFKKHDVITIDEIKKRIACNLVDAIIICNPLREKMILDEMRLCGICNDKIYSFISLLGD